MSGDWRDGRTERGSKASHRARHFARMATAFAALVGAGGGSYGAVAVATAGSSQTAAVEAAAMHALHVQDGLLGPPVSTSEGLRLADYPGAVQKEVTASSSPWRLCPDGAGITLSPQGVHQWAAFALREFHAAFTGVQQKTEITQLTHEIFHSANPPASASLASPPDGEPCPSQNWDMMGPNLDPLVQWSSVQVTGTTATVTGVVDTEEEMCPVSTTAEAGGAHAVGKCASGSPYASGGITWTWDLTLGSDGTWRTNDLVLVANSA